MGLGWKEATLAAMLCRGVSTTLGGVTRGSQEVSQIKRDRFQLRGSRLFGAIAAGALAVALLAAPIAAAGPPTGDPVKDGELKLNLSRGFKKVLKRNGVHLGPRKLAIRPKSSYVNPRTGALRLRLKGKLRVRGHGAHVVARQLIVTFENQGGVLSGGLRGKIHKRRVGLFGLSGGPPGTGVTRIGWGAQVEGIGARISRRFALKVNRELGLHSLPAGRSAGAISVAEQPQTLQVTGGYMFVDVPATYLPPSQLIYSGQVQDAILAKLPAHCVGPIVSVQVIPGPDPDDPARLTQAGLFDEVLGFPPQTLAAIFRIPVVGGTVGPNGKTGSLQLTGGIKVSSGASGIDKILFDQQAQVYGPDCAKEPVGPDTSSTVLESTWFHPGEPNTGPNLTLGKLSYYVTVSGQNPGCTFADGGPPGCGLGGIGGPGFKGRTVAQLFNLANATISADPDAGKVTIGNVLLYNNGLAATSFNQIFESGPQFPDGGTPQHSPSDFAYGDKFGIARFYLNTR